MGPRVPLYNKHMAKNANEYGWRGYLSTVEADLLVGLLHEAIAQTETALADVTHPDDIDTLSRLLITEKNLRAKLDQAQRPQALEKETSES